MAEVPDSDLTAESLAQALGGGSRATDVETAALLLEEATGIVSDALATAFRDVPLNIVNLCVVRVARSLKDSSKASTGAGQVGVGDVVPLRSPADPLTSSYPIIRRYVVLSV